MYVAELDTFANRRPPSLKFGCITSLRRQQMSLETLLLWVVVGLVAGWLASAVGVSLVGGGSSVTARSSTTGAHPPRLQVLPAGRGRLGGSGGLACDDGLVPCLVGDVGKHDGAIGDAGLRLLHRGPAFV